MADIARRNLLLNGFEGKVSIIEDDLLQLKQHFPVSSFDMAVSNPPYRRPGTGRISPKAGRDIARHESTAGLADFLAAAKYLVKPGGRICFIYHPSRLAEFLVAAAELKLAAVRLRMVHGTAGGEARMFLAELAKGRKGDLRVEPPLFVYNEDGGYTAETGGILGNVAKKGG
jgi:tRNA1Val (adenine37-N6)-methyltransferase